MRESSSSDAESSRTTPMTTVASKWVVRLLDREFICSKLLRDVLNAVPA